MPVLVCAVCNHSSIRHDDKQKCHVAGCQGCGREIDDVFLPDPKKDESPKLSGLPNYFAPARARNVAFSGLPLRNIEDTVPGLKVSDPVNHPNHYGPLHPGGPECIEVTGWMNFNLGNATKYLWRAGRKTPDAIEDLRKAAVYIQFEIDRLTQEQKA